jgi:hypothetical protein
MTIIALRFARQVSHVVSGCRLYRNERLIGPVRFGNAFPARWVDCFFDTGASFSVIGHRWWKKFASEITWLDQQEEANLPAWLRSVGGAAGGAVPIRLGSIAITVADVAFRNFVPLDLLAAFVQDDTQWTTPRPLLGLAGGIFERCQFHMDYGQGRAWLEFP